MGALCLCLILALALALRLHSVGFGLPALNDPDELTFELGAVRLLSKHTLNPGWFGHPATTTIYVLTVLTAVVFLVGHLLGWFPTVQAFADAIYADPTWVMLPGRLAMVAFAVGTIYLTWRLARELCGERVALVAAVLLAVNPVHITWSQIIRSDMMASFFMLLCLLAALRIARHDRWRDYVLAALWLGAAMATKWPYALAALAVAAAGWLRLSAFPTARRRSLLRLVLFGAMALGFLFLISPYLLLDHETAYRHMRGEAQEHHLGATGGAPWENAWWYLRGPILASLGLVGLLLAITGAARLARNLEAAAILGPVTIGFFVLLCLQHIVWERWTVALMPMLTILAAAGLDGAIGLLTPRLTDRARAATITTLMAVVLLPLVLRSASDDRMRLDDTRQQASRWTFAHVAPGSTVLVEHFAFDLLPRPWHFLFPLGEAGCVDAKAYLGGKVQLSTVDSRRGARTNVDFGTVAPAMRATCRTDYAILTQYDRYAAERGAFPVEYAAYRDFIAGGKIVATFTPEADRSGGPVVRIVRFQR